MMTSSIAVLQKFTNALFTKTGQSDSLSKLVNSLKRKKSKTLPPTDKQISTNAEKASSSPRVSLKGKLLILFPINIPTYVYYITLYQLPTTFDSFFLLFHVNNR